MVGLNDLGFPFKVRMILRVVSKRAGSASSILYKLATSANSICSVSKLTKLRLSCSPRDSPHPQRLTQCSSRKSNVATEGKVSEIPVDSIGRYKRWTFQRAFPLIVTARRYRAPNPRLNRSTASNIISPPSSNGEVFWVLGGSYSNFLSIL